MRHQFTNLRTFILCLAIAAVCMAGSGSSGRCEESGYPVIQHAKWSRLAIVGHKIIRVGNAGIPEAIILPSNIRLLGTDALITANQGKPFFGFRVYAPLNEKDTILKWVNGFPQSFILEKNNYSITHAAHFYRYDKNWSYSITCATRYAKVRLLILTYDEPPRLANVSNTSENIERINTMMGAGSPLHHQKGFVEIYFVQMPPNR